jgi:hypothetical protein
MENASQLVKRLSQSYKDFKTVLVETERTFGEFEEKRNREKCPTQAELVSVLKSFEEVAQAFSSFLQILYEVINDRAVIVEIQKMPPEIRGIGYIASGQLLAFHGTGMRVASGPWTDVTPVPYLHEQISQLAVKYGYYGCSMTASTSLISLMGFLTEVFEKSSDDEMWEVYFEFAPKFLKSEFIKGLRLMAERAAFLAVATEEELQSSEVSWWCSQIDMTPKDEAALYTLSHLIDNCPRLTHPDVIKRLKELAVHQGVDESIRKQVQAILE